MPSRPREKLSPFMQRALSWFEAMLYGIVALLLVAAAALVLIGTAKTIIKVLATDVATLEGGVLVLDRILLRAPAGHPALMSVA